MSSTVTTLAMDRSADCWNDIIISESRHDVVSGIVGIR